MSKKPPDPSPPPRDSEETARFKDLLRRLVAVPKAEVDKQEAARKRRKRRKST
jgi:hypothetical protein